MGHRGLGFGFCRPYMSSIGVLYCKCLYKLISPVDVFEGLGVYPLCYRGLSLGFGSAYYASYISGRENVDT